MATPSPRARARPEAFPYWAVLLVAFGHFVHDSFTAFYGVLLPQLAPQLGMSRGLAGLVTTARQLPAALNPFLGYLADRTSVRWFVVLAPGLTATGMTLLGWAPSPLTLAGLLFLVGVSTALFHAPAPALVARISHPYTGGGMSLFMAAGELGRALGPVLAVWGVTALGLRGLPGLALLGWLASGVLVWRLAAVEANGSPPPRVADHRRVWAWLRAMGLPLAVLIFGRVTLVGVLGTYLSWYLTETGFPWEQTGWWVMVYEGAGVAGALAAGTWSDRWGRGRTIVVATLAAALFLLLLAYTPGTAKVVWLPFLGASALAVQPVLMALVQDSASRHRATANGIYLALNFLLRPVGVSAAGALVDAIGRWEPAFALVALLAVTSLLALRSLPRGVG